MSDTHQVDQARNNALDQIEKHEKNLFWALIGIGLYELTFLILLVYFMDFSNQTHLVMFTSTFLVYGTLGLIILAFGLHFNRGIERILKAIQLQQQPA